VGLQSDAKGYPLLALATFANLDRVARFMAICG
jgi:hypothetical protein